MSIWTTMIELSTPRRTEYGEDAPHGGAMSYPPTDIYISKTWTGVARVTVENEEGRTSCILSAAEIRRLAINLRSLAEALELQ